MSNLSELSKSYGLNLKKLSQASTIPYTTIIYLSKVSVEKWKDSQLETISTTIGINKGNLKKILVDGMTAPFIKWVGGKRQLLPELRKYIPNNFNNYYEPFIGGGALLFAIKPKTAIINDFNSELINVYRSLIKKDNLNELIELLNNHQKNDSKEYYLSIRKADRDGQIIKMTDNERAARFIYLNRAGFNGLWRVNSKGQNNVPYGSHKKINLVTQNIINDSIYLQKNNIAILNKDYTDAVSTAQKNDFVYFDPPYVPINPTSSFTNYTKNGFGFIQQEELRDLALSLAKKGIKVMLSNSDTEIVNDLYKDKTFKIHHVTANRMINSKGNKRGKVGEVIITTY